MASKYDLLEYDSDEEREKFPAVPMENLMSAALFMASLFDRAGVPYGVMGDFAINLMGGERETRDVDIAFQAPGKMRDLWDIVEGEERLIVPNTRLLSNIMKVFVLTGPNFDECTVTMPIEIDLIESGFQNSPRDLSTNRIEIQAKIGNETNSIYAVGLYYLLRGKLATYQARQDERDRSDIIHVLKKYPDEIREFATDLESDTVSSFLESLPSYRREAIGGILEG
ncbi:hypothetical protein LOZ58_002358 [Ophidiomyces ophidiicola]|nr:hypothetical protein LOZ65_002690 [Ophidiomyces ophidiicola]KAI1963524.1 hypothetical protein LOZ58_002358 [Ophidiomyces ophidiicola]